LYLYIARWINLTFLIAVKANVRILLIISLSLLIGGAVQAQGIPGIQDTAAIRQQRTETEAKVKAEEKAKAEVQDQNRAKEMTKNQTLARANDNGQVKKVTSARPDMSKSKGARPGSIVRPAGSRLPKGVGRPGGAAGHGRR